jgi:predicted transglutaminase-like cysteine proteinase
MEQSDLPVGLAQKAIARISAAAALLLLCMVLSPVQAHTRVTSERLLEQRLPVAMKVTVPQARSRIRRWRAFVESTRHKSETGKLKAVNDYFNALRFVADASLWRSPDYWATPLQVVAAGAGDCEDMAIAKYFTLKTLGVADDRLRLTYVWNHDTPSGRREPHMVLSYLPSAGAEPLVLDILTGDIRTLEQRRELEPVYGLNAEGLWLMGDNARSIPAGSPVQLPQWRRLSRAMGSDAALLQKQ